MSNQAPPHAPLLSLVILCYRAKEFVREFVARTIAVLEEAGIDDFELVLVGNYVPSSDDPTPAVVAEVAAQDSRIRFTARPKEGWMGWDMRSGLEMARGEYIAVIDGDGQMPVSDVVEVFRKIRQDRLDLVKTFRLTRGDSLFRKFTSFGLNLLFRMLYPGLHSRDINSKPKIMTRSAYEKMELRSDDWFIDAEIMIQVRKLKLQFGEIPTGFLGLTGRRSFVNFRTIFEFLRNFALHKRREWWARKK